MEREGEQNNKRLVLKDRTVPREEFTSRWLAVTVRVEGAP